VGEFHSKKIIIALGGTVEIYINQIFMPEFNLTNLEQIKNQLFQENLHAKKKFGQNFLVNENTLNKIVETARITKDDTIIEIGPGLGTLTIELCKRAKHVISVEKDKSIIPLLKKNTKQFPNLTIVNGDALNFDPDHYFSKNPINPNFKMVANIPYYITSPLINHYLKDQYLKKQKINVQSLTLLTQKEVAEKISATPSDLNILALNTQIFANPQIIDFVPANHFFPIPKVDSAIIHIAPLKTPIITENLTKVFQLISFAFAQKRKMLSNSLSAGLHLDTFTIKEELQKINIDPNLRPENLEIKNWEKIAKIFL